MSEWWREKDVSTNPFCPNLTIFRILKFNKFTFNKKKKVLDIGFGNGENILEVKKRGAQVFGFDFRKNLLNYFVRKNNLKKKNFLTGDLNKSLPDFKENFNLIIIIDVLSYINKDRQKKIFHWANSHLKFNGLLLFSFTQSDLIQIRSKKKDNWEISKKYYKIKKINFDRSNPIKFLKFNEIISLFKGTALKLISSSFDISTYSKLNSSKIRINRFILMKKTKRII